MTFVIFVTLKILLLCTVYTVLSLKLDLMWQLSKIGKKYAKIHFLCEYTVHSTNSVFSIEIFISNKN